jgi:MFS family permease
MHSQALYLREVGLSDQHMGLLLYMTLVGDALISLVVTVCADGFGRRRTMLLGCLLKLLGATILAYVHGPQFWLLAFGATVGVISPSGNEVSCKAADKVSSLQLEVGSPQTHSAAVSDKPLNLASRSYR